jgi:hypothetical protein
MSQSIARAHLLRFLRSRGIDAIAVVVGIATFRRHSMEILEFNSCMNHTIREISEHLNCFVPIVIPHTAPARNHHAWKSSHFVKVTKCTHRTLFPIIDLADAVYCSNLRSPRRSTSIPHEGMERSTYGGT